MNAYLIILIQFTGIGYSLVQLPAIVVIQQYFDKRRTFANAVFNSGGNITYFCFPPFFRLCVDTFSWQGTLLVVGGLFLQAVVCGVIMRPVKKQERHKAPQDVINITPEEQKLMGVQSPMLVAGVMFIIGDICMEIGYRVYVIFTAMRCDMLGISKTETAWLYTIFGIVGLPAKPLAGLLGDRPEVNRTYMHGIFVALAGGVVLVTTAMKTFQTLVVSSVMYSLMAGSFEYRHFMGKNI